MPDGIKGKLKGVRRGSSIHELAHEKLGMETMQRESWPIADKASIERRQTYEALRGPSMEPANTKAGEWIKRGRHMHGGYQSGETAFGHKKGDY